MKTLEATILIGRRRAETIHGWLRDTVIGIGDIAMDSVIFPDGMLAEVRCVGCQDEPAYAEMILLEHEPGTASYRSVDGIVGGDYTGTWEIHHGGTLYRVDVKVQD